MLQTSRRAIRLSRKHYSIHLYSTTQRRSFGRITSQIAVAAFEALLQLGATAIDCAIENVIAHDKEIAQTLSLLAAQFQFERTLNLNLDQSTMESKGSILVVDDTPSNLRLLLQLLSQHGYRIHTADGGKAALRFLQSSLPDLILLDVMMPEMDGYEVCACLKNHERTRSLPVIFISAAGQPFDKVKAFRGGAVDYIVKPFEVEEVLARIETHLALRNLQKNLEQRVKEKTADLSETNARLRQEIIERKLAEETLRKREEWMHRLVESNIIGIFFWNIKGEILDANDAFLNIVGYSQKILTSRGIRWTNMTPAEWCSADEQAIEQLFKTGSCTPYEKEYVRRDGSRVPVLFGGAFLEGSQEKAVAFVLDLSERNRAEEQIRHLAQHDVLTDLPNRVLFQHRISQALAQAQRKQTQLAILFLDLDGFKNVNDSLGHQIGDRLLCMVANRLQDLLRAEDTVARLGGDEFVIGLLDITNREDAGLVAQKILEALHHPFLVNRHQLHIRGSIGISLYPTDGEEVEALMRTADTAMYAAKEKGRDNYQFFTTTLNDMAQRRLVVGNQLHQALQQGDLVVYYQPQVELETGRISGAEALVRWKHAEASLIQPAEFIRVAEETGLIDTVGELVLRQTCEQLKQWRNAGHTDLLISVNLSPYQLRRPGFPELVSDILHETGLPATVLEMEITEGVLMLQNQDNMMALQQLVGMGIRLSVDDFGTGYSSLTYLQRFPIHALKIDRSFMNGVSRDANDTAIVIAILSMAHSLNIKVVAEGVETAAQSAFLEEHGCLLGQGFYFSPPVPAEIFFNLLGSGSGVRT